MACREAKKETYGRSFDGLWDNGEVVKTLLDKETDDTI